MNDFLSESKILGSDGKQAKKLSVKLWAKGVVEKNTVFEGSENTQYYIRKAGQLMYGKLDFLNCAFGIVPPELDGYESTLDAPAFDINNINPCFLLNRIIQRNFYKKNGDIANGSRKAKRIHPDTFLSMEIATPSFQEQNKIAKFLAILEQRIEKQRSLIDTLKSYKRGYFNRLIASFSTVEYYIKDIVEEYTQKTLTNGEYPILSSTMNGIKMQSAYFNKQAASENTIGYKIVPYGYFTYRSMSDTGEFHFNYQDIIEKGIVSPAYPVFMVKATNNSRYVEYILNELPIIKTQLMVVKEGGTRYALSFSKLQALHIPLPAKELQDKVENQILLFEKQEKAQELILEKMIALKTALLQQLFI